MGLGKLEKAIDALPPSGRGPEHVGALDEATGKKIGRKEAARLSRLLVEDWARFTDAGRNRLRALAAGNKGAGAAPGEKLSTESPEGRSPAPAATRFTVKERVFTGIEEQSGLSFISPEHGFLAIDDRTSIVWNVKIDDGGGVQVHALREDDGVLDGLEGAAYDPDTQTLLVLSEDSRETYEIPVTLGDDGSVSVAEPRLLRRLPKLEHPEARDNKGWEGMTILPPRYTPDGKSRVLAVNEGYPKALAVLTRDGLEPKAIIELDGELDQALEDLSAVTVDPRTGHLFLLSDESEVVYECALEGSLNLMGGGPPAERWKLKPLAKTHLPPLEQEGARLQPEGLAFDHEGDLWVSTEGDRSMIRLERDQE